MRAIAEEAFAMVREYKGSHSGEHGDGLVRSEFHEPMFGSAHRARLRGGEGHVRSRRACSTPARSCGRPKMDDRSLFRFKPGYRPGAGRRRRSTGRNGAGSPARPRCATTTAPAASPTPGVMCPSLPRDRRRAASDPRPRQHAAPGACRASSAPTRSPRTRCARRWSCASRARAAGANARPASTWRG